MSGSTELAERTPVPRANLRLKEIRARLRLIRIIQAGMGVGVSSWQLAWLCAQYEGVLGTVSGVVAHHILVRTLQQGDPGGHMRRALAHFPFSKVAQAIEKKYFKEVPDGKIKGYPVFNLDPSDDLKKLMVVSAFVLVWLSKEGHQGLVSVNYLEKIQMTHIYYIFGAMLAGVDIVTMGAGIISQIPALLDAFARGEAGSYRITVEGKGPERSVTRTFDPKELFGEEMPELFRPALLAIVSSSSLAWKLLKGGGINGFVIEGPTAGGHNPPPRGKIILNEKDEPIYGERDVVDLADFRKYDEDHGVPFWLAGSYASPAGLLEALLEGATGVQCGSIFALCDDSGMLAWIRNKARELGYNGKLEVLTTLRTPTGYPFKMAVIPGTLSDALLYQGRERACSACDLRVPYWREDGSIGYRCSSEPIDQYLSKGGSEADALWKLCLCNALLATVGLGREGELPVVTMGDDTSFLVYLMQDEHDSYTAEKAILWLLSGLKYADITPQQEVA